MSVGSETTKCPKCGGSLVLSPDTTATITFYDCPSCPWHFAQKPGERLHDRWGSPLSIALYCQIFEKNPDQTAEENARALFSQRPDLIQSILDEIDRELDSPTQRVSEIHHFLYPDEEGLFLDSKHFSDFLDLGRSMRSGQAVLIGDKKMGRLLPDPVSGRILIPIVSAD